MNIWRIVNNVKYAKNKYKVYINSEMNSGDLWTANEIHELRIT